MPTKQWFLIHYSAYRVSLAYIQIFFYWSTYKLTTSITYVNHLTEYVWHELRMRSLSIYLVAILVSFLGVWYLSIRSHK